MVRHLAQHHRGDAAEAERQPIEEAADEADATRQQFHRIDQDGGEGARHDQVDDDGEDAGPEQIRIGQHHREGQRPEDREPDDLVAPDPVAEDAAAQRADRRGCQEQEQHHLRRLHRHAEFLDQKERVERAEARRISVLREQQDDQDRDRQRHACRARYRRLDDGIRSQRGSGALLADVDVSSGGPGHQDHGDERRDGEVGDAALPSRHDDEGRQQWPQRAAGLAAELEDALRHAVLPARRVAGHPCRFGMEDRRADADAGRGQQQQRIAAGGGEADEASQGEPHADHHRIRHRMLVGVEPDQRLQQRGRDLEGQRHQPDLTEIERIGGLDDRIDRRDQRLDHVVEQVRDAQCDQHGHGGALGDPSRGIHVHGTTDVGE